MAFASHHWPTWGTENVTRYLSEQRDLYAYLHDQTLRMLNNGSTGMEIAEDIAAAPGAGERLARPRLLRVGQPQRQGHLPALHGLVRRQPDVAVAAPAAGGGDPLRRRASAASRPCWTRPGPTPTPATCGSPPNCSSTRCSPTRTTRAAREALAGVYERLGYGAENATWRSFYLSGALELRAGVLAPAIGDLGAGMAGALTIGQLFDTVAVRVDGPRAAAAGSLVIDWNFTDAKTTVRLALSNGALIQTENPRRRHPPT